MSNTYKPFFAIWFLLLSLPSHARWYEQEQAIMGTRIYVQLWADNEQTGQQALDAAMQAMRDVDNSMSPYIESSELFKLNQQAGTHAVKVSPALFALIAKAQHISALSEGAFDISFASAGFLYNYREHQKPDAATLNTATGHINYQLIALNSSDHSIRFHHPELKIDLGGIAKGYAVKQSLEALKAKGISHALVSAGGDTGLLGDRRGRPWLVGIQDPRNKHKQAVKLPLSNEAISTSGDYERYFEQDGTRYHHILNPKTGQSAHEVQSVSVIGPDAIMTDALSTTVFVLGVKRGLAFINTLEGYEAIIIDHERKMHYSAGLLAQ